MRAPFILVVSVLCHTMGYTSGTSAAEARKSATSVDEMSVKAVSDIIILLKGYRKRIEKKDRKAREPYVDNFVEESFDLKGLDIIPGKSGVCGLENLGNTCFMNSALQCLSNCEPLTVYFLRNQQSNDIRRPKEGKLAQEYANHLKRIWLRKPGGPDPCPITPTTLRNLFVTSEGTGKFNNAGQHDSQEFLSEFQSMLGDDLNRINPEVPEQLFQYGLTTHEFADKRWEQEKARSSSIISDLFQWQLRSRSKCGCGALTFQFDAAFILSLAFPPAKKKTATNLHDMLQHYTSKEEVEDFYCERCNKNTTGRRKLDLWRLPSNLVVHLKRFSIDFDVTTKIMDAVDFPIDGLDLTPFTSSKQTDPPIYDLYAVTNHGGSTGGGHYWAYVKNFVDNKWYELNDPTASPLDVNKLTDNATRKTAYLLFYRRRKNLDRLA